jgi:hypothetical protein
MLYYNKEPEVGYRGRGIIKCHIDLKEILLPQRSKVEQIVLQGEYTWHTKGR